MKPIIPFIFLALFLPTLTAQEPPKRPARDSYRAYTETWGGDERPEDVRGQYVKLTVSPAKLPDPLLKYRLRVFSTEKESSNAAYLYSDALSQFNLVFNATQAAVLQSEEYKNANNQQQKQFLKFKAFPLYPCWSDDCYTKITVEDEERLFQSLDRVYFLLERASRKTYYDWSDSFEYKGIGTLLPNIQEMRTLGRYLSGKADWEIRNGKYEDAVKTLRIGLVLGEHVQDSKPFNSLVAGLVGRAIQETMQHRLHDLANQPDAPNLYAALTQVEFSPRALLDQMEAERLWMFSRQMLPTIYETIPEASDEECRAVLGDLCDAVYEFGIHRGEKDKNTQSESGRSVFLTYACLFSYPFAKESLLKQGKTEEEIEAMSTYKIVTPHIIGEIQRAYDVEQVISALPRGESSTAIPFDESLHYGTGVLGGRMEPARILLTLFLPATTAAKSAYLRTEQTLDRLKIIEAIRLYAAMNDGQLPKTLDAIKEVPVPKIDQMTGKPYQYRVVGNTAILEYETQGLSRMEVTVGR
ncbi:MAG: hypothetical protein FWC43_02100 [Planctomycetaceae bacterium]|nr:hypothetical protein [Planctomycetaceae bacterium]